MAVSLRFITITLSMVWKRASSSVAGITYMDDFGFEQRYRHVDECDPFYWHPLHLPEECADMYERLIRARLPTQIPKHAYIPKNSPAQTYYNYYEPNHYEYTDNQFYPTIDSDMKSNNQRELTPYEEMLESVQKDVVNLPSVPSVKHMPNFGPVAVYEQPISRISADMIKKVAMTYARTDDKKGRRHQKKSGSKWKKIVNKVRHRERYGWKKINNGDIVSFSKT